MPAWLTVGMYSRSDHCTSAPQPCAVANAFATSVTWVAIKADQSRETITEYRQDSSMAVTQRM